MFFYLFGVLVIHSIDVMAMTDTSSSRGRTAHRDYANKIGMLCSYDRTANESFYLELGENDRIGDRLESFGRNRKVIFYVLGYGADLNPDDEGLTLLEHSFDTNEWVTDRNMVVCRFDFLHKKELPVCCMFPDYRKQSQKRVPFAAKIIKNVVAEMYTKVFDSFENFDIVGFSLGAHVAGYTAKLIKTEFGETIPRIFALDPAKTFVYNNRKNELQKTDAKYVQAIFTSSLSQQNIDVHCKVFVNGGSVQPGCEKMPLIRTFCNHIYSIYLYDEIGAGWKFFAFKKSREDENYAMMVGHLSRENPIGVFYLKTNFTPGTSREHEHLQDYLRV